MVLSDLYLSTRGLVLRYRSLKKGAISCQQKYLTLIFFCLFAGLGEHHGKQGRLQVGEDMCGRSRKTARFKIVRKMDFKLYQDYIQRNAHIHTINTHASLYYVHIHVYMYTSTTKRARCICKLKLMAENILDERCVQVTHN
jgi:hypothetical protein